MPKDFPRARRVADQVQRDLAGLIRDHLNDPRLGLVTITSVEVSRDLAYADVHVAALGEDGAAAEAAEVLNNAAGFLRGELGRQMRTRNIPMPRFKPDTSAIEGLRMSRLIDNVVADDEARHVDETDPADPAPGDSKAGS